MDLGAVYIFIASKIAREVTEEATLFCCLGLVFFHLYILVYFVSVLFVFIKINLIIAVKAASKWPRLCQVEHC